MMTMTQQILDLVYTEKIREDEGGTYGVGVFGRLGKYPKPKFVFQIYFDTAPSKTAKLMEITYAEIEKLTTEGPSTENLNKVKEFLQKKHAENLKENSYWLKTMDEYVFTGVDMMADYDQILNSITAKDIQAFAKSLFSQKNRTQISMTSPE